MSKTRVLDLFADIIPSIDQNLKELWDAAGAEGQKEIKSDLWILNRFISTVRSTNPNTQEHFVIAVNEFYNKHWALLQKNHSQLLWMLLCACCLDNHSKQSHEYIRVGPANDKKPSGKKEKILAELYPTMKRSDIDALAAITHPREIKKHLEGLGWEQKEIDALKL